MTIITIASRTVTTPAAKSWGGGSTKTAWHWEIRYGDRIVNDGGKTFSDAEQAAAAAVAKVRELRYT